MAEKSETIYFEAGEQSPALPKDLKLNRKHHHPMTPVQLFLLNALIAVIAVWLMFGFIFGVTTCPTGDMYPRIDSGDLLLYFRLERSFKAQDVVVLHKNNTEYIGRIVAVGGDTVEITDDEHLVINGNKMIEKGIYEPTPSYEGFVDYPLKLEENTYFILADKRNGGEDSRYYGAVSGDEILGTVITVTRRTNL